MSKLKLPLGISDYKKIRDGNFFYVDKTLLIQDLWEAAGEAILIARPRRFGKTLNLSMLRYFFEKSDPSTQYLFKGTKIWDSSFYQSLQGQFPVIILSLKDCKENTYSTALENISIVIADEFARHKYLLLQNDMDEYEKNQFRAILERKVSVVELGKSLKFLSGLLSRASGKKCIVLIDEYDTPIHAAHVSGYYQQMVDFIRALLTSVLKDNTDIERGFLTGILRTAKEGVFSGLNNLNVFSLLREELADKLGFTVTETDMLLEQAGLQAQRDSIKAWYNSYRCGSVSLYNPWSLLKCVEMRGVCKPYWVNTSDNGLIKKLIAYSDTAVKSGLETLLTGGVISREIKEEFVFPEMESNSDSLWSLLFFSGYVTYRDHQIIDGKDICMLMLPNREIYHVYTDLIQSLFIDSLSESKIHVLIRALLAGDVKGFSDLLEECITNMMSMYDTTKHEPEKSYHLFVLGLLATLSGTYEVTSNRESGYGRYDIMIIPHDKTKTGIIIEFKKALNTQEATLEETAQKALLQIKEREYSTVLKSRGIASIIAYGIALSGKAMHVEMQRL